MLSLYKPTLEDLWFRKNLMEDPDTMSYNAAWGGAIPFPKENWCSWYDKWLVNHNEERFYRYLFCNETGKFVGEIAYHLDAVRNVHIANIIILNNFRGKGYGTEGLNLLCMAAKANGITTLYDDIAANNRAVSMLLNNGFTIDYQNDEIVMVKRELL